MDGYAVIAEDTVEASRVNPVRLRITGEIQAGGSTEGKRVSKGTAVRIMTGAPIPAGADSVVRFEDTEEKAGYVDIFTKTARRNNCRSAGENIKKGDRVLHKGHRLGSADIGVLVSLNQDRVRVYKQPTVSIISTGNELCDIGETLQSGQIKNINAYTLYLEVKKYNGVPLYLGICRDTLEEMKGMFLKALESDVVISTGGVSTGKYDFIQAIYSYLNIDVHFERVNVKPGSPCSFGNKENKLIFGLPGNPVPTLLSFIQFVRPALLKLMGAKSLEKPIVSAFLEEDIRSTGAYHMSRGFFEVKDNEFHVRATAYQKPSMLRSMSAANCLIILPENVMSAKAGEKVLIQLIDHDEI